MALASSSWSRIASRVSSSTSSFTSETWSVSLLESTLTTNVKSSAVSRIRQFAWIIGTSC